MTIDDYSFLAEFERRQPALPPAGAYTCSGLRRDSLRCLFTHAGLHGRIPLELLGDLGRLSRAGYPALAELVQEAQVGGAVAAQHGSSCLPAMPACLAPLLFYCFY